MVEVIGAYVNGPIRIGMTLLTTNEIAELVVFYGPSLSMGKSLHLGNLSQVFNSQEHFLNRQLILTIIS